MQRQSGILVHPTSFPNDFGIGDLGPSAYAFIDFLHEAKQSLWQILPLGPTSYGNSPYQCLSAFAGNPLLISPEALCELGYLNEADLADKPHFPEHHVDFGAVIPWKQELLQKAYRRFKTEASAKEKEAYQEYCELEKEWLDDFTWFTAIKKAHEEKAWIEWPKAFSLLDTQALMQWGKQHVEEIDYQRFVQYQFHQQWQALKRYANDKDIQIVGDLPIFVAYDSADVWANREWFELDDEGQMTVVAGVPPDYFSETGQRWGNPLYRWEELKASEYLWWQQRLDHLFKQVDCVRIDHFRGFDAYWEIPAEEPTAIKGVWKEGPGLDFFKTMKRKLGSLPIIAEDLGFITKSVSELREACGFPGMKVLQFAFSPDPNNPYLPHNYDPNSIVYTGTHDNNTTRGWFESLYPGDQDRIRRYMGADVHNENANTHFMRLAWASVAKMAIAPLQDVFNCDASARMNLPASASDNWIWRYDSHALQPHHADWLQYLSQTYER